MNKELIINTLQEIVSKKNVITNQNDLDKFNNDWRGYYNFKSICAVLPENVIDIKKIIKVCNQKNIKIVPQAGNTSLTGASVPSKNDHEIILNCKKMNKILSIDKDNLLIEVEAGATLDSIKKYASKNNFYFPISLSSSGSCLIAGNIATNAGGVNALKYGTMRDNLQGIEVLLADSTKISAMSRMKKNNTGYDIKHLFCGSEGTLGIITKALLKIYPKPKDFFHCIFAFKSIQNTVSFFNEFHKLFNEKLESAEIIPKISIDLTIKHGFLKKSFFNKEYDSYLLCKFSLFEEKQFFENIFLQKINTLNNKFEDLVIPHSIQQENNLWKFRDDLVESYKMEGKFITNDISLPINNLTKFISIASKKIDKLIPNTRIYSFGHLGDGNIHFNMMQPVNYKKNFDNHRDDIYQLVNDLVYDLGGSFSAEHGIGQIKKDSLVKYKDVNEINLMKKIKLSLDPKNIFNPGKIFDLD